VWGSIGKVERAQFLSGIVPAPADFFGQGSWVRKRIYDDRPVPHQGRGFGQDATLKSYGHIPSAAGPLSTSLSNSSVVGSEWLGVMAGVASEFKTAGERERTTDGKRFWLICTWAGVLCPG